MMTEKWVSFGIPSSREEERGAVTVQDRSDGEHRAREKKGCLRARHVSWAC